MRAWAVLLIMLFSFSFPIICNATEYAIAKTVTPVLNSPDFTAVFGGKTGHNMKTDRCGQVRELEYIAPPGTVFTILKKHPSKRSDIYQVVTDEYIAPPGIRLYVDSRFVKRENAVPPNRTLSIPPFSAVIRALKETVGLPYVWGGNAPLGIPEFDLFLYQEGGNDMGRTALAGLDCSGLLYYATSGGTPRNTSQLVEYGQSVSIAGKTPNIIISLLRPLDLIAWNGHVIIVLDRHTAIESRLECGKPGNGGVVLTDLLKRVTEVMRTRHPVNSWPNDEKSHDVFVVRRWFAGGDTPRRE